MLNEKIYDEIEKKLIWIFGTPRSGSTWLGKEILKREGIKVWDEPMLGAQLGAFRDDPSIYWHLMKGEYGVKFQRIIDQDRPGILFNFKFENEWKESLRNLIFSRLLPKFGSSGYNNIIIKAPNESHASDIIMKCFPNSKLVFLIRDGRDVIDSRQAKLHNPRRGDVTENIEERKFRIAYFSIMWNIMINITKKAYAAHNPDLRILVKYEELRLNPIPEISRIFKFLGYQFKEEDIKKIADETSFENVSVNLKGDERDIRKAKPGGYKDYFTEVELGIVNEIMKDNLLEFGYKI